MPLVHDEATTCQSPEPHLISRLPPLPQTRTRQCHPERATAMQNGSSQYIDLRNFQTPNPRIMAPRIHDNQIVHLDFGGCQPEDYAIFLTSFA